MLEVKGRALRQFASQVWPGSALDLWLQAPTVERFAPLAADWDQLPMLPSFYDEELHFGRFGASAAAVEAAFRVALTARTG